ncbi:secretory subunit [Arachnomyces sp. PD_36]|nr:secretory subunit [Arachnomyces sp. PD_36]
MSSTEYNYDDQGQFFPFFVLTLTGLVTFPLTYTLLKPNKELENTAPRINSDYKPEHEDLIQGQKQKQLRRERRIKRILTVIIGYAVMGWMIYLIAVTSRTAPKLWDPYDILGVSRSADEKAISRHYKRLSIKHHPDKVRPDPAKNETIESLNDHFVELTKAYKALTDEEIRNNYIQYGHPDGKQSFSIGIALPKFIVTEGNGKYVLLVYGAMLGVLLPYIVGKWWYGTQRYTKEKVLLASAGNIFREYKDDITEGGIVGALSSGEEYKHILKGSKSENVLATVEKKILDDGEGARFAGGLALGDREKLTRLEDSGRRKALALLWAYLGRVELDDATLNDEKYEVAPTALTLNDSFSAISLAFGHLKPILGAFHVSQSLIQATPPGSSPLLQLPHFTPKIAEAVEGEEAKSHLTVQSFMKLPESQRQKAVGNGLLSKQQYESAISVAKQLPALEISKAFFKVMGEKAVTPSSLVQLVVKARIVPPGYDNVPEPNEQDLEDIDPDEGDLDALLGRKASKGITMNTKGSVGERLIQPPLAHAPYFARDHSPRWFVFLADAKQGKMAVPPFTFKTFDKPLFDDSGKPTFNVQTLKMQFQAPPQVGDYQFVLHLLCDSYIGFDTKMDITLHVEDAAKAAALADDDDISEPDEGKLNHPTPPIPPFEHPANPKSPHTDSIAGQMQALKTGQAPPQKKKAKKAAASDESSDEDSDTDGEAEDTSETDTETDTDGED